MTTQEHETTAAPVVDPLVHTSAAGAGVRIIGAAIDLVCVVSFATLAILAFQSPQTVAAGWTAAICGAIALVWIVGSLARSGRTPGHAAVGTRTVSRASGAPSGRRLIADAVTGRLGTFDIVHGRDPVAPVLLPFAFPASALPSAAPRRRRGIRRPPLVELDSGERLALETALVIGRGPTASEPTTRTHQWADLSRTLSKSHLRLEWDGEQVWATDLGSTNGTAVREGDTERPLLAWHRLRVPDGTRLHLGDRHLTVRVPL